MIPVLLQVFRKYFHCLDVLYLLAELKKPPRIMFIEVIRLTIRKVNKRINEKLTLEGYKGFK